MSKDAPFDVWDGEDLGLGDEVDEGAAEEVAMHLDPDSDVPVEGVAHWSELTGADDVDGQDAPVSYFADEQPESAGPAGPGDERELDLEELLERQHYAFPD